MPRVALALYLLIAATFAHASVEVALQPLATGLDRPVQVVSAHDSSGSLYVALQRGVVERLDPDGSLAPYLDVSNRVDCCSNGGLLSVVFHPDYVHNGKLYLLYVNRDGNTTLSRFLRADPQSEQVLLVAEQPKDNVPNHHGGTLVFGPDGMLYVSIGDGDAYVSVTNRAQELNHLLGKLLRIDVDHGEPYAIPPDNPFANGFTAVRPEIWSYGLRNPWRYSFDRTNGELLLADVGQDVWEEVNVNTLAQARGANFGWPLMEGKHCYPATSACNESGLLLPAIEYSHSEGCSITGGFRYRGIRWPQWSGIYFYGDFCSGTLWAATQQTSVVAAKTAAMIVSFGEDDRGELYLVDYNGTIYAMRPAGPGRRRAV